MTRRNDYLSKVDKLIGDKIYSLRLAKGLTRLQLGEAIGVVPQQIQKYEKGVSRMNGGRFNADIKKLRCKHTRFSRPHNRS